ncbi:thioesterase family protein [Amycolatopsis sp. SID8362]|uniref:acyl-CoA thioesterase n=1 Tax=Amycolatopsis sp. SID8362 TaxID=2690346 RepID=UPI00136DB7A2|nr:thioesterase family protein [Amycolatopsis sp. SID8362]NBH04919.1 acyl-CoA thioesterase [Amycolatopsis sp. SID8362]NED41620.1 acyl-CoA thioesterase [Amycolatopsis sp. SID8362]
MTYVSHVRPRWTDMDVYGHINHAKMVTLLEEARIPLLFEGAVEAGLDQLPKGIVVVKLEVAYKAPIVVSGQQLRVDIDLTELRAASFTLAYRVHTGPAGTDPVAVTAETVLAPYDTVALRPRRLSPPESEFLKQGFADA